MKKLMTKEELGAYLHKFNNVICNSSKTKGEIKAMTTTQMVGLCADEINALVGLSICILEKLCSDRDIDGVRLIANQTHLLLSYIEDGKWPEHIYNLDNQHDFILGIFTLSMRLKSDLCEKKWDKLQEKLQDYFEILTEEFKEKLTTT